MDHSQEKLVGSKNVGYKFIRCLNIFNIPEGEHPSFFRSLQDLEGLVEDYISMKLVTKENYIAEDELFDYTIKLVQIR